MHCGYFVGRSVPTPPWRSGYCVEVIEPRGIATRDLGLFLIWYALEDALDNRPGAWKGGLRMWVV
jgi:hypothetical protein